MSFLSDIFARLDTDAVLARELRADGEVSVTGRELLARVANARALLQARGLKRGDRCALLAHNSMEWIAADLAIMAEGMIVVPLYARQAVAELVAMMKDCSPALICCGDAVLRDAISAEWPDAPPRCTFAEMFAEAGSSVEFPSLADDDAVTIIYTSGTSGEAKGVVLSAGNIGHMLGCTSERLDVLMSGREGQDRVFHYLPFCFAGSWILLLTCLLRRNLLSLNTDLSRMAGEMRSAAPHYFLNVPQLLERMRRGVDEQLWKTGGFPLTVYQKAKAGWVRQAENQATLSARLWIRLAQTLIFPTIRKRMIGRDLRALICGSAPLNAETQLYFHMLGIQVLQVYGLTETTAICTMDQPGHAEPGRVGTAIGGIEMKLGENDEIVVRGPNIFSGYWHRPEETAKVLRDGWFHTGDQGEVNAAGNWRIVGRIKNLIILGSGHNIAPEPIEDEILARLPEAQQVVLVGNGRSYLSAIVTGAVSEEKIREVVDNVNGSLPHYKQVRAWHVRQQVFSVEEGLLTANGKLRRDAIASRMKNEIEEMYRVKVAV